MFISLLFDEPRQYILQVVAVMFSICLHEYAHARVALAQGDTTAAENGHLTLNPMVQMGPMSLLMLAIIGISWGAVPVSPHRMRHRYSHALVAAAGPLTNLALFVVFSLVTAGIALRFGIAEAFSLDSPAGAFGYFCFTGAALNMVLFLLNMLPVPMLDGSTIFGYLFPALERTNEELRNASIFIIFMAFIFFGGAVFGFAYRCVFFIMALAGVEIPRYS